MPRSDSSVGLFIANFFTAVAGSSLLAIGMHMPEIARWGDSIFAYLIGALISTGVLVMFYQYLARFLFVISGLAFLVSLSISMVAENRSFLEHSRPVTFTMFLLMILLFVTVFLARSLRASLASKAAGLISWAELSYSLGYATGLTVIPIYFKSVRFLGLGAALLFIINGVLDRRLRYPKPEIKNDLEQVPESVELKHSLLSYLVSCLVILTYLTIIVQVGSQVISKRLVTTSALLSFDLGTLMAPILVGAFGIKLQRRSSLWFSGIELKRGGVFHWSVMNSILLCSLLMVGVLFLLSFPDCRWIQWGIIAIASLFYEMTALLIFDEMGKSARGARWVSYSFGAMALGSLCAYGFYLNYF